MTHRGQPGVALDEPSRCATCQPKHLFPFGPGREIDTLCYPRVGEELAYFGIGEGRDPDRDGVLGGREPVRRGGERG